MAMRSNPESEMFGDPKLAGDALERPIGRPLRYTPGLKCDAHFSRAIAIAKTHGQIFHFRNCHTIFQPPTSQHCRSNCHSILRSWTELGKSLRQI